MTDRLLTSTEFNALGNAAQMRRKAERLHSLAGTLRQHAERNLDRADKLDQDAETILQRADALTETTGRTK